jgi:hypothetical protein
MTTLVVVLFSAVAVIAAAKVLSVPYRQHRVRRLGIRSLSDDARRRFSADQERLIEASRLRFGRTP